MLENFPHSKIESPDVNSEALEALAERLDLKKQYLAQVKVLYQSGILENFAPTPERPTPEMGIVGIDGQEYILPDYEAILDRLKDPETRELIEKKVAQGFTKLQLTPFALPLSVLIDRYRQTLLRIHKETGIKATNGSTLELDENQPVYVWEKLTQSDNPNTSLDQQMEYGVTNYTGQTKEARGGKSKIELLQANPDHAWQLSLIEDLPDLPAQNQGQTIAGRKSLEANQSPEDYLKLLQTQESYQGETGQTPESALVTWLTYLQEKHTAIDDYQGQGKANWLVGNYVSGYVPNFYWYRDYRLPDLYGLNSGIRYSHYGFRPMARF